MSFDDLAYPNFGSSSGSIVKYCRSCEESREVRLEDWECRTCGERLERLQPGMGTGAGGTGTGDEQHGNQNLMMQQLFHQVAASAATASGDSSDLPSNDLASQLQSLFIPSLNSTYMDMVQAQQGISLDVLMERLLHEDSLKSSPCSKKFLESLIQSERPLESRDFIQIVVRVGGVERDIFPTIGKFGAGEKYVETHAKKIAEEQEEKKREKKKMMDSKQSTSTATSSSSSSLSPSSTTTVDSSATDLSTSSSASSTSAPNTVTTIAADADDDDDDDDNSLHDSPPISHVSSALVQSNPITGAPRPLNSRLFVGKWVLMLRGGITFLDKARFTQDAMGAGLIVIQTESNEKGWPFVITDSTGKSGDIIIPVLMVSKTDGEMIQDVVNKKKAANDEAPTTINVNTRIRPLACSICRDDYAIGSRCVTLPCHHSYCLSCITPWLEKRHLCPMCRYALPTDAKKSKEDLLGPESNHAQLQRDMFT